MVVLRRPGQSGDREAVRDDRLYALWLLVATTGMRRGELAGLRWVDIDFDHATVSPTIPRVVVDHKVHDSAPKTERSRRRLALDPITLAALDAQRQRPAEDRQAIGGRYRDQGYVFAWPDGCPLHPENIANWFEQHTRAAGLPRIRLHDVRHSYATAALKAGISAKVISCGSGGTRRWIREQRPQTRALMDAGGPA